MSEGVQAIRQRDVGRTASYELVSGPNFLGKLSVSHDRRRGWSALTIPTSVEPNSLTTAQFAQFVDQVYSDLFGEFAQEKWQECRVFIGDSHGTQVVWLGDEKNRNRFHSVMNRMKQRNSPYQYVRFETVRIGGVGFSLEKAAAQPGNWLTVTVSGQGSWTHEAIDWVLSRHADPALVETVDRGLLASDLAKLSLDDRSLAA